MGVGELGGEMGAQAQAPAPQAQAQAPAGGETPPAAEGGGGEFSF
jgi:hypothetical protein